MTGHHFLDPVDSSWAELVSDSDPVRQGAVELGNGALRYISPGSIPDQLGIRTELHAPLPKGRSEASEANSNSRQYASFGAANESSATNKFGV